MDHATFTDDLLRGAIDLKLEVRPRLSGQGTPEHLAFCQANRWDVIRLALARQLWEEAQALARANFYVVSLDEAQSTWQQMATLRMAAAAICPREFAWDAVTRGDRTRETGLLDAADQAPHPGYDPTAAEAGAETIHADAQEGPSASILTRLGPNPSLDTGPPSNGRSVVDELEDQLAFDLAG